MLVSSGNVDAGRNGAGPRRVLVVDPDEDTRIILGTALEAAGYEPVLASDVAGAWALASDGPVAVIITELLAPGAPDVPARLRERPDLAVIPMIVYSTRAQPGDFERALLAGASEVLVKPVPYRTIVDLVARLVRADAVLPQFPIDDGTTRPLA